MVNGPQDDIHDMTALFKEQLKATHNKCTKNICKMYDQERNYSVSYHPEIEEKRSKAKTACHQEKEALGKLTSTEDLNHYCTMELAYKKGLFYQIYRGKLNKYVNPKLPSDLQTKLKFER